MHERPEAKVRKTVTMLFADVTGSTTLGEQLDAETLRRVLERYFEEMRATLDRHGGSVEKFVGDAVLGVFGIPVTHEDDALRAVRAGLAMRDALTSLNTELAREWGGVQLGMRIGINTGEVVAGDPRHGERFATGSAVNLAARLEQAADPGDVLIGSSTYALVRDAIEAVEMEPLSLKGVASATHAYRVLRVREERPAARPLTDTPFVGRALELDQIVGAFGLAVTGRSCRVVTVYGNAGLGKSRLASEALARFETRATLLIGRCLPYGEGITYWPVVEAVKQATSIGDDDPPERVRAKIAACLGADEDAVLVAERVAHVVGVGDASASRDETFWALRRLLEAVANKRPLVLLLEDLHWAAPTLLDLVEYIANWWSDAPVLVLCLARPELLETRAHWAHAPNGVSIQLTPLGEDETDALIDSRLRGASLAAETRQRIKDAAEGNPLFVEQILAMSAEASAFSVPPTIQALLAARLDLLGDDERAVLERASVVGRFFSWDAVRELTPPELWPRLTEHLLSLVRKELLAPDSGAGAEHGFRFTHILIRDAAYGALLKEVRADLHEQFAVWIERQPGEFDEIVGYHYEQAFRYREQLGSVDDRARGLAARAGSRLGDAGRRAHSRGDTPAAVNLLERATSLLPADAHDRLALLPELGRVLTEIGSLDRAEEILTEAVNAAEGTEERSIRATALLDLAVLALYAHPDAERGAQDLADAAEEAVEVFEASEDHAALAHALDQLAYVHWTNCRYAAMEDVLLRGLAHAALAGDHDEQARIRSSLARCTLLGPMPVEPAIARCRSILEEARGNPFHESIAGVMVAGLEAMRGRFVEAQERFEQSRIGFRELGHTRWLAALPLWSGPAQLLAGAPDQAEAELKEGYESLQRMGDRGLISPVAAFMAQALYEQGRYDEAVEFVRVSEACASRDDLFPHVVWRGVHARILARDGSSDLASTVAREAVALADKTDSPNLQGDACLNLAEVLRLQGDDDASFEWVERALGHFEAKGNIVSADAAQSLLARA
ncbi:MAG TPA: adenylate/guanylate cyclase domain-containing protein [Gaiellaceae bacterium]|nr:adenylate/guanylate cyclase domain-containing protein [Gaiellaceae bacterium]